MPHQLTGVAKGMKLWNGIVGGGIWGDHMGLGKTLSIAVTCMLMKDQTPGDFCLVVTSRASAQQWLKELNDHFKPVSHITNRCKVHIMSDSIAGVQAKGYFPHRPQRVT